MGITKAFQFGREVRAEARKTTWPDFKSTRMMTLMVFILVVLVAVYLYVVDALLSTGITWFLGV